MGQVKNPKFDEDGNVIRRRRKKKIAINSIQRTALVERMPTHTVNHTSFFWPYDTDNLYPNKVKSIVERSTTASGCCMALSEILAGEGFGEDINPFVINRRGQTLWDNLRFVTKEETVFKGFALHFNYNLFGQIIEINEIPFELLRWNSTLDKLLFLTDWKMPDDNKVITYEPFNPDAAQEQIRSVGIDKYNGQVLYYIPRFRDIYTTAKADSALDDMQFEAESKLFGLSTIQNQFSASGVIKTANGITNERQKEELRDKFSGLTGSGNGGSVVMIDVPPGSEMAGSNLFESFEMNNIDSLFANQCKRASDNIMTAHRIPPVLLGLDEGGVFNLKEYAEAFTYANVMSETVRKDIERVYNKIVEASIWSDELDTLTIKPKIFGESQDKEDVQGEQEGDQVEGTGTNDDLENGN